VLGFRRSGATVTLAPCLPPSWPRFELTYRYGRSALHVIVENTHANAAPGRPSMDGRTLTGTELHLVDDGRTHEVRWTAGERRLRSSA
jgi:cellobiose phosphorylase